MRKFLKWLCDRLIKLSYGIDPDNIKPVPEKVKYIPDIEMVAGVISSHDPQEIASKVNGGIAARIAVTARDESVKTLIYIMRRESISDLVIDSGAKSERIKGRIEALEDLYDVLQNYNSAVEIRKAYGSVQ